MIYEADAILSRNIHDLEEATGVGVEQRYPSTTLRLEKTIKVMYPDVKETQIPVLVEDFLTTVVAPHCKRMKIDGVPSYDDDGQVHLLFVRGSLPARRYRETTPPFAPPGYFKLPDVFQRLILRKDLIGGETPLVMSAITANTAGPDVDIMLRFAEDYNPHAFQTEIEQWMARTNEIAPEVLRVVYSHIPLAEWNGPADPRVYVKLTFQRKRHNEWSSIFGIDIGESPWGEDLMRLDGRLTPFHSKFDNNATARVFTRHQRWYLSLDGGRKRRLRDERSVVLHVSAPTAIRFLNGVRVAWVDTLWPTEPLARYIARQHTSWFPNAVWRDQYQTFPFGKKYFGQLTRDDVAALRMRESEFVRLPLLSATLNWVRWMEVALSCGYLGPNTQLGQLLGDHNIHVALLAKAIGNDSRSFVAGNLWGAAEYAASLILNQFQHLDYIGPLELIRILREIGALPHDTPITIGTFINLVNPVIFWEKKLKESLPFTYP